MIHGGGATCAAADDLGLQRPDARVEFVDGEGIEILPRERRQRLVRPRGKSFFLGHVRIVDRARRAVNKPPSDL